MAFCIHCQLLNILRILHARAWIRILSRSGHSVYYLARCCDALFLLAETGVAMKTVITSQVKKNCVFTGYQIFVSGKILVFHRCLYNIYTFLEVCLKRVRGAGVMGMRGMKKRELQAPSALFQVFLNPCGQGFRTLLKAVSNKMWF